MNSYLLILEHRGTFGLPHHIAAVIPRLPILSTHLHRLLGLILPMTLRSHMVLAIFQAGLVRNLNPPASLNGYTSLNELSSHY